MLTQFSQYKFLAEKRIFIFILFYLITCIIYFRAAGTHFLDDTLSWMYFFIQQGWGGFYNSFDFTSLYWGHDLIYNSAYILFGTSKWPWFFLLTGLHVLNAFMGFVFTKKILERNNIKFSVEIALAGALLFLLSPHQTENVVWGATMHYGFSMVLMWAGFIVYERFLLFKKAHHLIVFYLLFMCALITLEISLMFPGLYFIVFTFLWGPAAKKELKRHIKFIVIPMAIIILLYFLINNAIHRSLLQSFYQHNHTLPVRLSRTIVPIH